MEQGRYAGWNRAGTLDGTGAGTLEQGRYTETGTPELGNFIQTTTCTKEPMSADTMEPLRADTLEPRRAGTLEPVRAGTLEPLKVYRPEPRSVT